MTSSVHSFMALYLRNEWFQGFLNNCAEHITSSILVFFKPMFNAHDQKKFQELVIIFYHTTKILWCALVDLSKRNSVIFKPFPSPRLISIFLFWPSNIFRLLILPTRRDQVKHAEQLDMCGPPNKINRSLPRSWNQRSTLISIWISTFKPKT